MDFPAALRVIAKGQYVKYRVFFADEETAIAAGYRPCVIEVQNGIRKTLVVGGQDPIDEKKKYKKLNINITLS